MWSGAHTHVEMGVQDTIVFDVSFVPFIPAKFRELNVIMATKNLTWHSL